MHLGAASCELQVGGAAARQARGGFQEGGTNLGSIPRLPPSRPRRNSLWLAEWGRCGSQTRCGCAGGSLGTATPKGKGSNSPWAFWGGTHANRARRPEKLPRKAQTATGKAEFRPIGFPAESGRLSIIGAGGRQGEGLPSFVGSEGWRRLEQI